MPFFRMTSQGKQFLGCSQQSEISTDIITVTVLNSPKPHKLVRDHSTFMRSGGGGGGKAGGALEHHLKISRPPLPRLRLPIFSHGRMATPRPPKFNPLSRFYVFFHILYYSPSSGVWPPCCAMSRNIHGFHFSFLHEYGTPL